MQAVFRPFEIEAFEAQMDSDQDSNQLNIDQAETGSNSSDSGVNSGSGKSTFVRPKVPVYCLFLGVNFRRNFDKYMCIDSWSLYIGALCTI